MIEIDDIINSSYFIYSNDNSQDFDRIYNNYLSNIKEILPINNVQLKRIYSLNRSCEIIEKDGERYLIYDQYLGQTLNMLNRIYMNSNDRMDILMYCYKIVAELLLIQNKTQLSFFFSLCYLNLFKQQNSYRENETNYSLIKRSRYTYIQEYFILVHELMHIFIRDTKVLSSDLFKDKQKELLDILIDQNEAFRNNEFLEISFDQFMKDIDLEFSNGDKEFTYRDHLSVEEIEEYKKQYNKNINTNIGQERIATSSYLAEECLCDEFALFYFLKPIFEKQKVDSIDYLVGIQIGIQHIRSIKHIELLLNSVLFGKEEEYQNYIIESQFRLTHYRKIANEFSQHYFNESIQDKLVECNLKHSKFIFDPILFKFPNRIDELLNGQYFNNLPKEEVPFEIISSVLYDHNVDILNFFLNSEFPNENI